MAVLTRVKLHPNERLDGPDARNLELFVAEDFNAIMKYIFTESSKIIKGFQIYQDSDTLNDNPTSSPIYVKLSGSAIIHSDANNNPYLYVGAESLSAEKIDLITNSTNYLEMDLSTSTDSPDTRVFWDQTSNAGQGSEFPQVVDTAINLDANFTVNGTGWSGGSKIPVAEIVVDGSGVIVSLIDRRNLFFRLGTGQPENKLNDYSWPDGRIEESPDRKISSKAFTAADKSINTFKDWMDAVMSVLKEVKGSSYWFSSGATPVSNVSLSSLFFDSIGSSITGSGYWDHNQSIAGQLTWSSDIFIKSVIGKLYYNIPADTTSLNDGDVAYIELVRNQDIIGPTFNFVNSSPTVSSTAGAFSGFEIGDWIKAKSHSLGSWGRIQSFNTGVPSTATSVTLENIYKGPTTYESAVRSQGEYSLQVDAAEDLPSSGDIYWVARREDDGSVTPKIYIRGSSELQQGEKREINDNSIDNILRFIGSPNEQASNPPYKYTPEHPLPNRFDSSEGLTDAISINAENINVIAKSLFRPYYESLEISGSIASGSLISLPLDSRDGDATKNYLVGSANLMVFLNGQHLSLGRDYNEVGSSGSMSNQIEILFDLVEPDLLEFRMFVNEEFFPTRILIEPQNYFTEYKYGLTGSTIAAGGTYNIGTDKLDVYRNGVISFLSANAPIGDSVERYSESSDTEVTFEDALVTDDLVIFINEEEIPNFKIVITDIIGQTIDLPKFSPGTDRLRVFRNGVLLNKSGYGAAIDQYTEIGDDKIQLVEAAVPSDVFVFIEKGADPTFREDVTGQTGDTITITNTYNTSDDNLLVYRNGILIVPSASLGDPIDRYQKATTTTITLEVDAVADDWFSFIYR